MSYRPIPKTIAAPASIWQAAGARMHVVFEAVTSCTLDRNGEQLRQAITDGRLRPQPLGSDDEAHRRQ